VNGQSRAGVMGIVVTVVVAVAIVAGVFLLGSPAEERARRLDGRRVQDLSEISRAVDVYWTRRASLPATLQALRAETGADTTVTDPGTNAPYEFRAVEGPKYELCAVFEAESGASDREVGAAFWSHRSGRQCFERDAANVR
jgi:hypothetical protein